MIPRLKPYIRWYDFLALIPWSRGNAIIEFEKTFAQLAGQNEAIAFPYGRTALIMLLKALRLQEKGKTEVICPSYTCVVVAHAIMLSKHTPVFVDTMADGYNMDWDYVEKATNAKTGAVVATSLFGYPVDLEALERYRAKHPDVLVLQDCAHSFMAAHDGKPVNKAGIAAFYGLNISKIITSIFGGMVTTDDVKLAQALRKIRSSEISKPSIIKSLKRSFYFVAIYFAFQPPLYGMVNWLERKGFLERFAKYYDPAKIDLPIDVYEGMSPVEARIGRMQCRRYQQIIAHRRKIALIYLDGLRDLKELGLPKDSAEATWSHFVIKTPMAKNILAYCLAKSIQLGELIEYDIADMPVYANTPYYGARRSRSFPNHVINLPVHIGVSEKDAMRIVSLIKNRVNVSDK